MLKTRVLTAVVALALFLAALLLLPRGAWVMVCALILGVAAWEWGGLVRLAAVGRGAWTACLVALFLAPSFVNVPGARGWYAPPWAYYAAAFFWVVLAPLWMWRRPGAAHRLVLLAVGAAVLVPGFAALVDLRRDGWPVLLALLATVWVSDTAAYFVGRRFGRRKLAPAISPGKTWAGVAGALAAVALYALAWASLGSPASMPVAFDGTRSGAPWIVPVLLALAVAGMIGDLFESLIKRQAGVKDSGTILPGHGGVLDRIDALLAMLPLAVLAFTR
jgi:phosphatidate cytidylyltransferase